MWSADPATTSPPPRDRLRVAAGHLRRDRPGWRGRGIMVSPHGSGARSRTCCQTRAWTRDRPSVTAVATPPSQAPEPGQLAWVRDRMWVVGDVARDAQASVDGRRVQHLVSLVSVEDDA